VASGVIVADPNVAAMYGTRTRRIKTDRRDVAAPAGANRTGVYRPAHRVSPAQRAVRQRLLVRDQLVRMRTQLINVLRAQVRATGQRMATGAADTVSRRVSARIEEAVGRIVDDSVAGTVRDDLHAVLEQMATCHPREPHWYLPMIGVDPPHQGRGYGGALLSYALERCDRGKARYARCSTFRKSTIAA
jgi:transposase